MRLFSNFPHGTGLAGLNATNIPELQNAATAAAVTTLVIEGNASALAAGISGLMNVRAPYVIDFNDLFNPVPPAPDPSLLPGLVNVSLPGFT